MKKIILSAVLLIAILIGCSKGGTNDGLNWEENLESALQKAKTENKAVLVNFTGSDWCIWCQRLSGEVFSQPEFKEYADANLILVRLDFPKDIEQSAETKAYNYKLAQKYGIRGYPTILLFNSSGKLVKTTGYLQGGPITYVNDLKSAL